MLEREKDLNKKEKVIDEAANRLAEILVEIINLKNDSELLSTNKDKKHG